MRTGLATGAAVAVAGLAAAQGFEDVFDRIDPATWHKAAYVFGHPAFDTDWRADLVEADKGLVLGLEPQTGRVNRFVGASLRRLEPTGYGRYEAVIQPARGAGIVTGFFTYTGPAYGTRHDEIDIEFLGKNTRQIHIATFVDGKLWNKFIDLGFDAAAAPQIYAFDWSPERIRWFVGDRMIYERTAQAGPLPAVPGRVFANIWAADRSVKDWAGAAQPGTHASARLERVSFRPLPPAP